MTVRGAGGPDSGGRVPCAGGAGGRVERPRLVVGHAAPERGGGGGVGPGRPIWCGFWDAAITPSRSSRCEAACLEIRPRGSRRLEAAMWTDGAAMFRLLERQGAVITGSQRRRLACLARDLGRQSTADYLMPPEARGVRRRRDAGGRARSNRPFRPACLDLAGQPPRPTPRVRGHAQWDAGRCVVVRWGRWSPSSGTG